MNIEVVCRTGKKKDLLEQMAHFCVSYLNIKQSRFNLWIFTQNDLCDTFYCDGMCFHWQNNISLSIDASLKGKKQILTFAHEMIHVKQIARGILKLPQNKNDSDVIWCGKKFKMNNKNLPWEIQAHKEQDALGEKLQRFIMRGKV